MLKNKSRKANKIYLRQCSGIKTNKGAEPIICLDYFLTTEWRYEHCSKNCSVMKKNFKYYKDRKNKFYPPLFQRKSLLFKFEDQQGSQLIRPIEHRSIDAGESSGCLPAEDGGPFTLPIDDSDGGEFY